MKMRILPNLVFKKKPEYKRPKLELYLESEEEDDEEEEEEDRYDVEWDKTDESEEDESKTQEKKARKNCTNCKGTTQCSDGERLNELRPGTVDLVFFSFLKVFKQKLVSLLASCF